MARDVTKLLLVFAVLARCWSLCARADLYHAGKFQ